MKFLGKSCLLCLCVGLQCPRLDHLAAFGAFPFFPFIGTFGNFQRNEYRTVLDNFGDVVSIRFFFDLGAIKALASIGIWILCRGIRSFFLPSMRCVRVRVCVVLLLSPLLLGRLVVWVGCDKDRDDTGSSLSVVSQRRCGIYSVVGRDLS